ncbi:UDP-N-acetylglucosamine 2-epimerase (non-hydrolyzing) [Geobacter hydrogenophilus]|uniref:non-hydrolyzing UDP-N-acetylglucosamine 2-epimerase n=1 Tax=Geobacter hydrogenophilus TaxID=40983 RepID=UPI001BD9D1FB|nr:UDP-N-acetylglucosamine 2-epimerase (non-hydrolyzing) [Geobacter hydrogenophilus]MBT0894918.1 UDP-N-acetylglucosamine 2-epimerase (non-hydrolyzing) [Geobacter hydrogenophilus]
MKIVTIVGARPQFIKAAAVSREIVKHPEIREIIVHTGQHFDVNMSDVFFNEMDIPRPDYYLDINSMAHGAMTGRMLEKIEEVLNKEVPDFVMVYGDTNSTLAGALAAKKALIKVVHVEAGLRSFNMHMPEEINRILTDRISDILCCPTDKSIENLTNEGFKKFPCQIKKTGDVMQDAALFYGAFSAEKSTIMRLHGLEENDFTLCTLHRAENTDNHNKMASILDALNQISQEMKIVMPLHPRTRKIIESLDINLNFVPIAPVGYFDMIELLKHTKFVLTDSGGLQKEAYFFNKPCITLREETEWVELVEAGVNQLVGSDTEVILTKYADLKCHIPVFTNNLYGCGNASKQIVDILLADNPVFV